MRTEYESDSLKFNQNDKFPLKISIQSEINVQFSSEWGKFLI